jgi:hypothetical protein
MMNTLSHSAAVCQGIRRNDVSMKTGVLLIPIAACGTATAWNKREDGERHTTNKNIINKMPSSAPELSHTAHILPHHHHLSSFCESSDEK